jgi:hypothetical protein
MSHGLRSFQRGFTAPVENSLRKKGGQAMRMLQRIMLGALLAGVLASEGCMLAAGAAAGGAAGYVAGKNAND